MQIHTGSHALRLRRMGIDTYQEPVVYLRSDSPACRAEGFEARSRIKLSLGERHLVATLNIVDGSLLEADQAGLSEWAWRSLGAREGEVVRIGHADPVRSEGRLRAKVYGESLSWGDLRAIIEDVVAGEYSELQLAAFVTACAGDRLSMQETVWLTQAMGASGPSMRRITSPKRISFGGFARK